MAGSVEVLWGCGLRWAKGTVCQMGGGLNPPQSGAPLGAVLGQCIDVSHEAAIKIVRINETMSISSRLIMLIPINCYELCYAVSIFQSF